jgi:hypothetical protein
MSVGSLVDHAAIQPTLVKPDSGFALQTLPQFHTYGFLQVCHPTFVLASEFQVVEVRISYEDAVSKVPPAFKVSVLHPEMRERQDQS